MRECHCHFVQRWSHEAHHMASKMVIDDRNEESDFERRSFIRSYQQSKMLSVPLSVHAHMVSARLPCFNPRFFVCMEIIMEV